jgi:hypothetical protein
MTAREIYKWIVGAFGEAAISRAYPSKLGMEAFTDELKSLAKDFPTITLAQLRAKAESEPSYGDFPPTAGKLRFWCKTLLKEAENRSVVSSSAMRAKDERSPTHILLDAESHARYVLAIDLQQEKERFPALREYYYGLLTADARRLGYTAEKFLKDQEPSARDVAWVLEFVKNFNNPTPASTESHLARLRKTLQPVF